MKTKTEYEVLAGNIGRVHVGHNKRDAERVYRWYCERSKAVSGRSGGEDVTLFKDGEIVKEYTGSGDRA